MSICHSGYSLVGRVVKNVLTTNCVEGGPTAGEYDEMNMLSSVGAFCGFEFGVGNLVFRLLLGTPAETFRIMPRLVQCSPNLSCISVALH